MTFGYEMPCGADDGLGATAVPAPVVTVGERLDPAAAARAVAGSQKDTIAPLRQQLLLFRDDDSGSASPAEQRRRAEGALRRRAVELARCARAEGHPAAAVAAALDVAPRTLSLWRHRLAVAGTAETARGRPPQRTTAQRRAEVLDFLTVHGPSLSLGAVRAQCPDVARAELGRLVRAFRVEWQREHAAPHCTLDWLCPGRVWAMDFSHPPHPIDGRFGSILNVRDLASHQQLLWLPVEREDAATVRAALLWLFTSAGPPLVLKCDNGPAFRAAETKNLLESWSIFGLYSPPYRASYNGACERANRTLKELTAHLAERAGRPGFWTSADFMEAQLRANRLSRPWGAAGPSPEERWANRRVLRLDERAELWENLRCAIAAVRSARGIEAPAVLPHYTQSEIERIAAQPVLEALGLLHVRRRRITPANCRRKSA